MKKKEIYRIAISGLVALVTYCIFTFDLSSCRRSVTSETLPVSDSIPDTLRFVTLSGSTTYFYFRGEDMGYEYDLAKLYAQSIKKPFKLIVAANTKEMLDAIDSGKADLCITPQAITQTAKKKYQFVGPVERSAMVLVQVKSDSMVTSTAQLPGKEVCVAEKTRAANRLRHLNEELGGGIKCTILRGDTITDEDLIEDVAEKKIKLTFADEKLALLSRTYYDNIDVSVEVGLKQRLSWIVKKDRIMLAKSINDWAKTIPNKSAYLSIYKRYFEQSKNDSDSSSEEIVSTKNKRKHRLTKGKLSPYDDLFKHHAMRLGWPWQLLASIAYTESRFNPKVIGWSSARGLMGIMPATGRRFGANNQQLLDPETSIRVAVDCLLATKKALGIKGNSPDEIKITLAAYNVGPAHVQDAQRLAKKYHHNPLIWSEHIEKYLRLKNDPVYYNDSVCKAGYLRGGSATRYVNKIMNWYESHKH